MIAILLGWLAHAACAQDPTPPPLPPPSTPTAAKTAEAAEAAEAVGPTCPATVAALAEQHPEQLSAAAAATRLQGAHLIVVQKGARWVGRYAGGVLAEGACWRVGLGFAPEGTKQAEGDGRTPEGWYRTSDKPWSQWYAAIAIHYPNAEDARAGQEAQRITAATARSIVAAVERDEKPPQTTALGGEILLHGGGSSSDWTLGCIAMNDEDIDALRAGLPRSMRADVLILP